VLISSFFIKISVSNFVNYNADYRGALMTKHPRNLTAAIKKINEVAQHNQDEIWFISSASLWTVNPFKKHWFVDLLTSEPPIERRIRRLEEISGL
jgi:Zn-dependent protease with chaperone function